MPAGWFTAGGGPEAADPLPVRRLWVDGFVIRRCPVTNAEYLAFLNDLLAQGREEEALQWAPREGSSGAGALIYDLEGGVLALCPRVPVGQRQQAEGSTC